ncbi:MAG: transporter substrate-binding domain-containing protein [Bacteroidetes bacterium]|nr:transporter substrate-binding domain-containing protein [Bacteroidota bacterium]
MKRSSFVALLFFTALATATAQDTSMAWHEAQKARKGTVTVHWFANSPFCYKDPAGHMKGIEVEIMQGFQDYLKSHHHVDLSFRWVEDNTFNDVLTLIKSNPAPGTFGLAGFSFSDERKTFMKFSPSYMADITVLVSTPDIPIVKSKEDLKKYLDGTTALTAKGTLLERELMQMRDENKINFAIEYTGASKELVNVLHARQKSFGYLNLPVYLMNLDKGLNKLNRQNYLTKRYEGRGIGMPITSDWDEPMREYFASDEFKIQREIIIGHYVDLNLYHFIETFNPENEVGLLNKEKDIQQMQLKLQELTIRDKEQREFYLIVIISVVTVLLIVIAFLFRSLRRNHLLLMEQKAEIEAQSEEIHSINNNLEETIRKRTRELENKNKALEEYAFITAHKLRAPLASILGLVSLVNRVKLPPEDMILINHLNDSAKKLDDVVHSVMNAIDTDEETEA